MAGEIQAPFSAGKTVYAQIRNRVGQIWNTSGGTGAFETYSTAQISVYAISLTEQGTASAYYTGNMPAAIPAGLYNIVAKEQKGGSVAETDPVVAAGTEQWNGTVLLPLSDLATSGQLGQIGPVRLARGIAVSGFPFKLVSATDHITPFTSGVVSGQISRDGGSFGALQSGAFTELGLGWYKTNLTSGDLLATTVALVFTANGVSGGSADQRDFSLIMQRTSGQ